MHADRAPATGGLPARAHVVGIGGIGMSAVAEVLHRMGVRVTGSDRAWDAGDGRAHPVLRRVHALGIPVVPQDGRGARGADVVIVSSAIEADNPERRAAEAGGIEVVHRAAMLARALASRRGLAVTGTSGKTTVTAMLGHVLVEAGWDPLVVNGGQMSGALGAGGVGNVRWGDGPWAVYEADESDRSLLAFEPEHAIITNASADHFAEDEVRALFETFAARVSGCCVRGDREVAAPGADLCARDGGVRFTWDGVPYELPMVGVHNAANALQVVRLAAELGLAAGTVQAAMRSFAGVHRRLERVGTVRGVTVLDDYAHNPAKVRAALEAARVPGHRVLALWRPHGFGPLRTMLEALSDVFAAWHRPGDRVCIRPVYDAGGTADRSVRTDALVEALQARGCPAVLTAEPLAEDSAIPSMLSELGPGDVVLSMGARDPGLAGDACWLRDRLGGTCRQTV